VTEELRVEMQAMHEQQKQDVELQEQLEYTKLFQVRGAALWRPQLLAVLPA
jgi:hypothetical protein